MREIPPKHLIKFQSEIQNKKNDSVTENYRKNTVIDPSNKTKNPFKELKTFLNRNKSIFLTIPTLFVLIVSIYIFI